MPQMKLTKKSRKMSPQQVYICNVYTHPHPTHTHTHPHASTDTNTLMCGWLCVSCGAFGMPKASHYPAMGAQVDGFGENFKWKQLPFFFIYFFISSHIKLCENSKHAKEEEAEVMKNHCELNMCFSLVAKKVCWAAFRLASHFACL